MITVNDAAAIGDMFGLGPNPVLTGPVARGEVGQVWKLTSETAAWAIKEAFEPPHPAEAEHDACYQELVAGAGVNVPHVQRAVDGRVLVDIAGSLVRVYAWVDLAHTDIWIDPAAVGQVVASIHRVVCHDANDVHPWYTAPVGVERWHDLVVDLHAAGAPFADQLADQVDELLALEALLRAPEDLQACHRDLFADNVLATPTGDLCVIDWENSGLADPSQELAVVLFEYGRGQADRVRLLFEAYVHGGGSGRVQQPGDFSMLIAQLGHIGEIACQRWLDPSRVDERRRNESRINEFLTERITIDAIDETLAAVA
jgi:hypothetical protein